MLDLWSQQMRQKWLRLGIAGCFAAMLPWGCCANENGLPPASAALRAPLRGLKNEPTHHFARRQQAHRFN